MKLCAVPNALLRAYWVFASLPAVSAGGCDVGSSSYKELRAFMYLYGLLEKNLNRHKRWQVTVKLGSFCSTLPNIDFFFLVEKELEIELFSETKHQDAVICFSCIYCEHCWSNKDPCCPCGFAHCCCLTKSQCGFKKKEKQRLQSSNKFITDIWGTPLKTRGTFFEMLLSFFKEMHYEIDANSLSCSVVVSFISTGCWEMLVNPGNFCYETQPTKFCCAHSPSSTSPWAATLGGHYLTLFSPSTSLACILLAGLISCVWPLQ